MERNLYVLMAVVLLGWLVWADYRGWAPGTAREDECRRQEAGQDPCNEQRTIRRRTYRGGK